MNKSLKVLLAGTFLSVSLLAIDSVGTITKTAPAAGSTYNSADTVTFSWNPVSGATKYYYIFDNNGSTVPASAGAKQETISNSILIDPSDNTDGTYYFHIQAVDATGTPSFNTTRVNIDVDTLKGTVSMSPDGGSLSSAESLTMTPSETGTIYYTTDGSTPDYNATSVTGTTQVYTAPLSIATAKTVKARVKDSAGNKGNVTEKVFTSTLQVTAKTTQDNSAVDGATFATKSDNLVQTVTPNTSITVSGTGFTRYKYKTSSTDYVTVTDINTPIDISGLETGNYVYYILGGDAYNYKAEENKLTVAFSVDNSVPTSLKLSYDGNATVTKVNPALSTTPSTLMSLSATGASELRYIFQASAPSTYAGYTSTYSSPFALTNAVADGSTGTVTLQYAAKDASGNWAKGSRTYTIDKKDPVMLMPNAESFSLPIYPVLSADDNSTNIKYSLIAEFSCNNSGKTYTSLSNVYNTPIEVSGITSCLYAAAKDSVGNEGDVSSVLFTFNSSSIQLSTKNLDGTPFVDNQRFATDGQYGAIPVTDINVSLSTSGTRNFTYEYDNNGTELNATDTHTGLVDLTVFNTDSGVHTVTLKGYKVDGELNATKVLTFTVDNIQPTSVTLANITFPTSTYEINVNIPSDAESVIYQKNSDANVTISSNTVLVIDSNTTLSAWSVDSVGNIGNITTATYVQNFTDTVKTFNGKGWKMITLPTADVNTSTGSLMTWAYDNNETWTNNIAGDEYAEVEGNVSRGYWVYCTSDTTTVTYSSGDTSTPFALLVASAPTNWTLAGTTSTVSDVSSAYLVWTYTNGVWQYATTDTTLNITLDSLGYTPTTTINAYSAYWLYKQ